MPENTLDSLSETYFYTISQNIPREEPDYYSDFTVRDILPECLEFVSAKVEMMREGCDISISGIT